MRTCLGGVRGDECPGEICEMHRCKNSIAGDRIEEAACPQQRPCSFWAGWSEWSQCSASVSLTVRQRARTRGTRNSVRPRQQATRAHLPARHGLRRRHGGKRRNIERPESSNTSGTRNSGNALLRRPSVRRVDGVVRVESVLRHRKSHSPSTRKKAER